MAEEQQSETTSSPVAGDNPPSPEEPDAQVSGRSDEQPTEEAPAQIAPEPAAAEATAEESSAPEPAPAEQTAPEQSSEEAVAADGVATTAAPVSLPDLAAVQSQPGAKHGLDLLNDVELNVKIELGRSRMLVEDVLRLGEGSVVELDKLAGDPVDVLVNERLVARGEVLVLSDCFCVRINEIVSPGELTANEGTA